MDKRLVAFFGAACVSACAGLTGNSIRHEGLSYRQLTGEQLRSTLEGKQLTFPGDARGGVISSSVRCHRFHVRGFYERCQHRVNRRGTYVLSNDRICVSVEGGQEPACWRLYSSSSGTHLLKALFPNSAPPERVSIFALPELNWR